MTIKERVEELEKLQVEEGIRHVKRRNELDENGKQIHKDCPHSKVKTVQTSIEAIDVCEDCGKLIH